MFSWLHSIYFRPDDLVNIPPTPVGGRTIINFSFLHLQISSICFGCLEIFFFFSFSFHFPCPFLSFIFNIYPASMHRMSDNLQRRVMHRSRYTILFAQMSRWSFFPMHSRPGLFFFLFRLHFFFLCQYYRLLKLWARAMAMGDLQEWVKAKLKRFLGNLCGRA